MTKPRNAIHRELYGVLGSFPEAGKTIARWNKSFTEKGIDAWMAKYPATKATLPERLSEMFHFDRRAYIVSPVLKKEVMVFLDQLSKKAQQEGRVNTIVNERGVLTGDLLSDDERAEKWLSQ